MWIGFEIAVYFCEGALLPVIAVHLSSSSGLDSLFCDETRGRFILQQLQPRLQHSHVLQKNWSEASAFCWEAHGWVCYKGITAATQNGLVLEGKSCVDNLSTWVSQLWELRGDFLVCQSQCSCCFTHIGQAIVAPAVSDVGMEVLLSKQHIQKHKVMQIYIHHVFMLWICGIFLLFLV